MVSLYKCKPLGNKLKKTKQNKTLRPGLYKNHNPQRILLSASKIGFPDRASIQTQERRFWRDCFNGAKLRRVHVESEASHIE